MLLLPRCVIPPSTPADTASLRSDYSNPPSKPYLFPLPRPHRSLPALIFLASRTRRKNQISTYTFSFQQTSQAYSQSGVLISATVGPSALPLPLHKHPPFPGAGFIMDTDPLPAPISTPMAEKWYCHLCLRQNSFVDDTCANRDCGHSRCWQCVSVRT